MSKKTIEFVLCILGGYLGLHCFYNCKIKKGFIYLLTFGLFGFGWIIDTIKILTELLREKNEYHSNNNDINDNSVSNDNSTLIEKTVSNNIDYKTKQVKVINENGTIEYIKQYEKPITSNKLGLFTIYMPSNKYHTWYDCYENWNSEYLENFEGWQIKNIENNFTYKQCIFCQERDYKAQNPNAKYTAYNFHFYNEDDYNSKSIIIDTKLFKTTQKDLKGNSRQNNLKLVNEDDEFNINYQFELNTYLATNNFGNEIGEISKLQSQKIYDYKQKGFNITCKILKLDNSNENSINCRVRIYIYI